MQKQQDIGKANWLSNPTLMGGRHFPPPGHQDPRSEGLGPTHSLFILPKYPNSAPLGIEDRPTTPL